MALGAKALRGCCSGGTKLEAEAKRRKCNETHEER